MDALHELGSLKPRTVKFYKHSPQVADKTLKPCPHWRL